MTTKISTILIISLQTMNLDQFRCHTFTSRQPRSDEFDCYDFHELVVVGKDYPSNTFQNDFGMGLKTYSWTELNFTDSKYAVVEEHVPEEQIQLLAPYCQCCVCKMSWFNLAKYLTCRCCVGCLYVFIDTPRQDILKATREYIKKNGIVLPPHPQSQ